MDMKKLVAAVAVAGWTVAQAAVSVTNVKVQQRWPWNGKVDIDYEVVSDNADDSVFVYPLAKENDRNIAIAPRTLSGELPGPVTWYLGLQIPIEMFSRRTGVSPELSGQVWNANVFKCADWTSKPCWLLWHKSYTFHNPEGFGKFIFE